jgi:hypothetical protein
MRKVFGIVFSAVLLLIAGAPVTRAQGASLWTIQRADRQVLVDDIAYYQFTVVVGPGQYDKIRIHRVVREQSPYQPLHLSQAIMFFAGEPTYFASLYIEPLISAVPARDRSIAIYLAKNDIDVWGMDYRWALVPENTTDFRFMKDWGIARDAEDAQIALTFARSIRGSPFEPSGPLLLTGLSYGAMMTYAVAASDTQRPPKLRNVKGIIPLDCGLKYNNADATAEACSDLPYRHQLIASGTYYYDNRSMWQMGQLASSDPNGTSPFGPPLTNFQFALVVATEPNDPVIPWHFAGGYFDPSGMPYDLRFTEPRLWFDLLAHNEPPYSPVQLDVEGDAVQCGTPGRDARFADHLGDITVPILYMGAAGGFGPWGDYTTTLTASKDVTIHIVQVLSDAEQSEDYGHADLVAAKDAKTLVWQPILDWLKTHH